MFGMGPTEIILILAIALIVIGPKKLPELGRSLGKAFREFKTTSQEFKKSFDEASLEKDNKEKKKIDKKEKKEEEKTE